MNGSRIQGERSAGGDGGGARIQEESTVSRRGTHRSIPAFLSAWLVPAFEPHGAKAGAFAYVTGAKAGAFAYVTGAKAGAFAYGTACVSSIIRSRLYLAKRSDCVIDPTLMKSPDQPTAKSASQLSSVSPLRALTATFQPASLARR